MKIRKYILFLKTLLVTIILLSSFKLLITRILEEKERKQQTNIF